MLLPLGFFYTLSKFSTYRRFNRLRYDLLLRLVYHDELVIGKVNVWFFDLLRFMDLIGCRLLEWWDFFPGLIRLKNDVSQS